MFRPFVSNPSIWHQISPSNFPSSKFIFSKRFSKIKIISTSNPISQQEKIIQNSSEKIKRKKGRRKLKSGEEYELALHTKDNDDNIKRKVKTHFHNFIVAYIDLRKCVLK